MACGINTTLPFPCIPLLPSAPTLAIFPPHHEQPHHEDQCFGASNGEEGRAREKESNLQERKLARVWTAELINEQGSDFVGQPKCYRGGEKEQNREGRTETEV